MPRQLVTGPHTVSDISCTVCGAVLGWKYVAAEEESQRYKVGKFILETKRVLRGLCWEHEDGADHAQKKIEANASLFKKDDDGHPLDFDSGNEDECEDLFMGIWSEALARKRRKARAWKKDE
jgi:Yippee zinc-binding/DNA-binding /Mis18, centromere assembly